MPSASVVISKCTVNPDHKSTLKSLKLSVSDLPMLSCQYIQKGVLLSQPPHPIDSLISLLKTSLSKTLTHFPALAGRLSTDDEGRVHILCNDAGVEFVHSRALHLLIDSILAPVDVPYCFKRFFQFDDTLSYAGHSKPLAAVQVTELGDGLFIGCTINHAVVDGTSFWNFFNTFAEVARGVNKITKCPDFTRDTVFNSQAVLSFPAGGPTATFSGNEPLRERIFHFSREAILKLKSRANHTIREPEISPSSDDAEIMGKMFNDRWRVISDAKGKINGTITSVKVENGISNGKILPIGEDILKQRAAKPTTEISSFQSLCAHLWRSVTLARNLDANKTTTFRMAVNCRHRLEKRLHPFYFGNAIQSIPTVATAGDLLSYDLNWGADKLHQNVVAYNDATVRQGIKDWESNPKLFPLGNFDGAMITMGSSPRFPMYDNDFGWGLPLAVRSGKANKFDGKISAFPGREGNGSVDLEVVLAPETMAGLENDSEFMHFVS